MGKDFFATGLQKKMEKIGEDFLHLRDSLGYKQGTQCVKEPFVIDMPSFCRGGRLCPPAGKCCTCTVICGESVCICPYIV